MAGLVGPWGSGKTSLMNLVAGELADVEDTVVVLFNPWFFTGAEDLIQLFFGELASQLMTSTDRRLAAVAAALERYAKVLDPLGRVPTIGTAAGGLTGVLLGARMALQRKSRFNATDLRATKAQLEKALYDSGKRFVVLIDDVDRLEPYEIKELVRLVRLVGDLPQTSYLLAFDRVRVETALGDGDLVLGRDYLEKIVQVVYNVPPPASDDLSTLVLQALDQIIDGVETGPFDSAVWGNYYQFVVRPLIKTPRDARRYVNSVPSSLTAVGVDVALADVLALDAVRIFMPDAFVDIASNPVELTSVGSGAIGLRSDDRQRDAVKLLLEQMIERAGKQGDICRAVLKWIFPAAGGVLENVHYGPDSQRKWRRERRVADVTALRIYLQRVRPPLSASASAVDAIFTALRDGPRLDGLLRELSPAALEESLDRLEDYEPDFPDDPRAAIAALLAQLPRLRTGRNGMWDFGADLKLDRILLRLIRRVKEERERDEIVKGVLSGSLSLSERFQLLQLVGYEPNAGHELVSRSVWEAAMADLTRSVLESESAVLQGERALPRLLYLVQRDTELRGDRRYKAFVSNVGLVRALLVTTLGEGFSQTIGEAAVRREFQLPWEFLETLVGKEELGQIVDLLAESLGSESDQTVRDAIETAGRYNTGWRPEGWERRRTESAPETVVELEGE